MPCSRFISPRLAKNLLRIRRLSLPVDTLLRWLVPDLRNRKVLPFEFFSLTVLNLVVGK